MKSLITEIERKIQVINQVLSDVLTYDNFKFSENKRDERADDERVFRSIIIYLIVKN